MECCLFLLSWLGLVCYLIVQLSKRHFVLLFKLGTSFAFSYNPILDHTAGMEYNTIFLCSNCIKAKAIHVWSRLYWKESQIWRLCLVTGGFTKHIWRMRPVLRLCWLIMSWQGLEVGAAVSQAELSEGWWILTPFPCVPTVSECW